MLRYAAFLTGASIERAFPPRENYLLKIKRCSLSRGHLHIERNPRRVYACRESRNIARFADKSSSNWPVTSSRSFARIYSRAFRFTRYFPISKFSRFVNKSSKEAEKKRDSRWENCCEYRTSSRLKILDSTEWKRERVKERKREREREFPPPYGTPCVTISKTIARCPRNRPRRRTIWDNRLVALDSPVHLRIRAGRAFFRFFFRVHRNGTFSPSSPIVRRVRACCTLSRFDTAY